MARPPVWNMLGLAKSVRLGADPKKNFCSECKAGNYEKLY